MIELQELDMLVESGSDVLLESNMCADELVCQTTRGVKLYKLAEVNLQVRL
jgi:hypothetical protein